MVRKLGWPISATMRRASSAVVMKLVSSGLRGSMHR